MGRVFSRPEAVTPRAPRSSRTVGSTSHVPMTTDVGLRNPVQPTESMLAPNIVRLPEAVPVANTSHMSRATDVGLHIRNSVQPTELMPTPNVVRLHSDGRVYAPDPDDDVSLRVVRCDLNIKNNVSAHRTPYDITDAREGPTRKEFLVVRRGQYFDLVVDFNRPYDAANDDLRIVFQYGNLPVSYRRTHVEFVLSKDDPKYGWGGYAKYIDGRRLVISVIAAVDCPVGRWDLRIDVVNKIGEGRYTVNRYPYTDKVYILFNPWCKADNVYLHDDDLNQEYVLADEGIVYRGDASRPSAMPWVFGQFYGHVLDCCLDLIEANMSDDESKGDPIAVSREISRVVNSPDDGGILEGRWSGDYSGGTPPWGWTGSTEIFERYYRTRRPVKYAQCWVYAGCTTTFCRALGIPCRSVTNYSSAHDTDKSVTIDSYYDRDGNPISRMNKDSVWNFHVWNDCWMTRPDLPKGYGGWQAVDATPQERSSRGTFACGPCSLSAIRKGEVNYNYDCPFIFAEVNADRVYWMHMEGDTFTIVGTNETSIGQNMITKRPNVYDREDVTRDYKFAEGTPENRNAVERAQLYASHKDYVPREGDVKFDIEFDPDTFIGDDFVVSLRITNTSGEERTVNGSMILDSMYYTGNHFKTVRVEKLRNVKIPPKTEGRVTIRIGQDEYYQLLTDHFNCKVTAIVNVEETDIHHAEILETRFRKPKLTVQAPGAARKGERISVEVSFRNPMNQTMTGCELLVEGPGLQRPTTYKQSNVAANATFSTSFDLIPYKVGRRELVCSFNSDQVASVTGSKTIVVRE